LEKNPTVNVNTEIGSFKIELFSEEAPITVENFLKYVNSGFYNGLIFHLVVPNCFVQSGGFDDNLNYVIPIFPPIKNEANNGLKNKKGTIAIAHSTEVDSATSQFFINLKDNPEFDFQGYFPESYGYTVFGKIKEGFEILEKIGKMPVKKIKGYGLMPEKLIKMINVELVTE
jgi:cyclophilin family peptidyl-prolyl cis-trans isomerase